MSKRRRERAELEPSQLPARLPEQLLIDMLPELQAGRVVCTSLGRAQFAIRMAETYPEAQVCCHFLDLYLAQRAGEAVSEAGVPVEVVCDTDLSASKDATAEDRSAGTADGNLDLVVLPLTKGGDAELARDHLQAGHLALKVGGRLAASTDNPRDTWLHDELQKMFGKVSRHNSSRGNVYIATKTAPLKKVRHYDAEFAFRDGERLIRICSRPGVFSHRRLDLGARALMEAMTIRDGDRVLDLGCGAGAIALAAAQRAADVQVLAVDSNPRAVQCTERGAALNKLTNVTTMLRADGVVEPAGEYDTVLTNPPYFSDYRIATLFLLGTQQALRPGGTVQVVTRSPDWFVEVMSKLFEGVEVTESRTYFVVSARTRRKPSSKPGLRIRKLR